MDMRIRCGLAHRSVSEEMEERTGVAKGVVDTTMHATARVFDTAQRATARLLGTVRNAVPSVHVEVGNVVDVDAGGVRVATRVGVDVGARRSRRG